MSHASPQWRPESRQPEHLCDIRYCLALMRILRKVAIPTEDIDASHVARVLWPGIRRHPGLLLDALARSFTAGPAPIRVGRRGKATVDVYNGVREWMDDVPKPPRRPKIEPPNEMVLTTLGSGLLQGSSACRLLFDAVERDLEKWAERPHPMDAGVATVSRLLQFRPIEQACLRLAVACNSRRLAVDIMSYVQRPLRIMQALSAALQHGDGHDVRAMLRRDSGFIRSGLLDVYHESRGIPQDLEDFLRLSRNGILLLSSGARSREAMASIVLKELPAPQDVALRWPHLEDRAVLMERLLRRAASDRQVGVNILLYGAPGTGKTEFASALSRRAGLQGYAVAIADNDGDPASRHERLSSLTLTQLFAPASRSVVILDEAEDIFKDEYNNPLARMFGKRTEAKAWMNDLLERNQHPVIWISNRISHLDPAYVRRFTYCLEFPRTPRGVRRAIAHAHLSPTGCPQELIDSTASDPAVTPGMLASAARFSQLAGLSGDDVAHGVDRMLKDMVRALGEKTTNVVPPRSTAYNTRFLNVLGPVTPDAVLGGLKRLGRGRLLLSGPPGTGKTQFAAEIAQQLGRQLVYKTASDINSMWFGESERNVARMFDECDASGEVLFLDEADTLMTSRNNANHRPEVAVTAEFLRQVELFQGVFVCATNFGGEIDAALMRRFEFRLQLLALSLPQRLDLFANVALGWQPEGHVPRPQLAGEVQSALQALDLLTPGDFANVVRRIDSLQLTLDANGWLAELRAEHDTKPGARRSAIGFTA